MKRENYCLNHSKCSFLCIHPHLLEVAPIRVQRAVCIKRDQLELPRTGMDLWSHEERVNEKTETYSLLMKLGCKRFASLLSDCSKHVCKKE